MRVATLGRRPHVGDRVRGAEGGARWSDRLALVGDEVREGQRATDTWGEGAVHGWRDSLTTPCRRHFGGLERWNLEATARFLGESETG